VWTAENNQAGNWSRYNWELAAVSKTGYGSYTYDAYTWYVNVAGQIFSGASSLNFGGSGSGGDYAGKTIGLGSGTTSAVGHDSNGYLNFIIGANHSGVSVFGTASISDQWVSGDRIPKPPSAPGTPSASSVATTSMTLSWTLPSTDNGAAIDQILLRRSTNPDLSGYTDFPLAGNATSYNATSLTPGTTYYWAVYAHNLAGYSPRSGIRTQGTLPATAPGMAITPTVSGTGASVALTPPGSASGLTSYEVQYRLLGSGSATTVTGSSSPIAVTGLTPGATYEWRASAYFGSYQSPWTDWTPIVQVSPNTYPGDYYDGSTPSTDDVDYAWAGTENNSASTATGVEPEGWGIIGYEDGGLAKIQRVTGGLEGDFAAKVIVFEDCGVGLRAGTLGTADYVSAVEAGATYWGSILVETRRVQRMAAELTWLDASYTEISTETGGEVVVDPFVPARLTASGIAPSNAEYAAVRAIDVAGDDHSPWLGGEWFLLDAAAVTLGALYPYFDGNSVSPGFLFEWLGAENASPSSRTPLASESVDPLIDPDCDPLPVPPSPPVVEVVCIDEVGTWRRYWVQIPADEVSEWMDVLPTITIATSSVASRQVRIRIYENPDGVTAEVFDTSEWEAEMIVSYIPSNSEMVLDSTRERATATVAGGDPASADHLLYGTGGLPVTWPVLSCGQGYLMSLDVPLDSPVDNETITVELTRRR
jgi:hypothetical protein